jgi:hypothetical protein
MPTKDGFDPNLPLPLFLANEPEQQGIGNEAGQPRLLKASILVAIAAVISIAISSVGNRVTLFAGVTASVVDNSTVQPGTDQSTPTVQSAADAEALPPTAKDAFRAAYEIAAASEPAGRNQTENSELSSEALFREFQAWAAEKDAQAQVGPVQQPVQDAPAKAAGNARASLRLMQKHRHVRPVHNARAEMRPAQNPRKKIRREQNARVEVPSAQDARAQVQYVQNPLLQIMDWRN